MSDKPIFVFNELIVNAQSMGATITSSAKDIGEIDIVAFQAVWSAGATPVGVMTLEASEDDITYTTLTESTASVSGNTGSILYNVTDPGYRYIRIVYTRTSGSGTLNVRISGKLR